MSDARQSYLVMIKGNSLLSFTPFNTLLFVYIDLCLINNFGDDAELQ